MSVVNTRPYANSTQTRRQYVCPVCHKKTITFELEEYELHHLQRHGNLRERITAAVLKAIADTK